MAQYRDFLAATESPASLAGGLEERVVRFCRTAAFSETAPEYRGALDTEWRLAPAAVQEDYGGDPDRFMLDRISAVLIVCPEQAERLGIG